MRKKSRAVQSRKIAIHSKIRAGKIVEKGAKSNPPRLLRPALFLILFIAVFSVAVFSLQSIYSSNVITESIRGYGTYQNGVFKSTGDVLVASPYSVGAIAINAVNGENSTRQITFSLAYSGSLEATQPQADSVSDVIIWKAVLGPYEQTTFRAFGKGFEGGELIAIASDSIAETATSNVTNKPLFISNPGNNSSPANSSSQPVHQAQVFTYSIEEAPDGVFSSIYAQQSQLGIAAKSLIVILAGIAALVITAGAAMLLGQKEKPNSDSGGQASAPKKAKIHTEDFYNGNGEPGEERYSYSEQEYWEKK